MIDGDRPRPVRTSWSEPFWNALRDEQELVLQRCASCGKLAGYPKVFCPHCYSDELEWEAASGRGQVYTHTRVEANPPSPFIEALPYTLAVVQLEEGPRFLTCVRDPDGNVRCGMDVELSPERVDDDLVLPFFAPVRSS